MISLEHKKYIKKYKTQKIIVNFLRIFIFILFIFIWQYMADNKIINTFIFSSPKLVIDTIVDLYKNGNLLNHIWVTVYEVFISFSLGTLIGCLIATILWWNKIFYKVIEPYLTVINSLPKVALGPIIIIWFGAGIKSIIFMALLISVIITVINVYDGFDRIDPIKIKLLKTFKVSKYQMFRNLIVPGNYKTIISALKINVSMSLIGVIMGEFLVSKKGIGYLILYGSQVFNLSLVISGIIVLCLVAVMFYLLVSFFESRIVK